jgi:hypothetical protein
VQSTIEEPAGNVPPVAETPLTPDDEDEQVGAKEPLTESVAVTEYVTAAVAPLVVVVMSAGTIRLGAVVSLTVTVNVAVALLPAASVAVQVTVVLPSANMEPEAGRHTTVVGETVSTAVGVV